MDQETARKREAGFLSYSGDAAAVYLFRAGETVDRPEPLERVRLSGGSPMESGFDRHRSDHEGSGYPCYAG